MLNYLRSVANQPVAAQTDDIVADAISVILEDPRVSKAVFIGREDNRPMIDFDMEGFSGVYSLGRVISALLEASVLARKAEEAKAEKRARDERKQAKENKRLLSLSVPKYGYNEAFDDFADDIESDLSGVSGELVDDPLERARLYDAFQSQGVARKVPAKRWTGPSLSGLTGSTKQRHWAASIRAEVTEGMSDERREEIYAKFPRSKWWIDNRYAHPQIMSYLLAK